MMSRHRQLLCYLPLILCAGVSIYIIAFHHVWPLSRDQWHMYAPYFENGLWSAALTPMSDHRHVVPFLFFHADMAWFGGLNHFLVATGALFNVLIMYVLLRTLYRDSSIKNDARVAWSIWIVFLLCWLINIAQSGWGFMSTQYYLAILCCLLAVSSASYSITLSLFAGIVATFSFGMGILVWPLLLITGWLRRADVHFYLLVTAALFLCLSAFLLMPGGGSIRENLLFSPMETLRFVFHMPAGPVYYLLKSYRFIDIESLQSVAVWISTSAVACSLLMLGWLICKRDDVSPFLHLCIAMVLIGLGSTTMITFIRTGGFLDVWVDRYQIWAILFWCGFIPSVFLLLKKNISVAVVALLPLLAMPSQLDMGARLSEYNIRVRQALLTYQAGLPEREAAEDALHWNWENKLPYFFIVWSHLEKGKKNIFASEPLSLLGQSAGAVWPDHHEPLQTTIDVLREDPVYQADLLDISGIPEAHSYRRAPETSDQLVGNKVYAKVDARIKWDYAVWLNSAGVIVGIGIRIDHNPLPRGNLNQVNKGYNLFGVIRNEGIATRIYLVDKHGVRTAQANR